MCTQCVLCPFLKRRRLRAICPTSHSIPVFNSIKKISVHEYPYTCVDKTVLREHYRQKRNDNIYNDTHTKKTILQCTKQSDTLLPIQP